MTLPPRWRRDTPAYLEPGTCACGREMGFCDTNCLKCECNCYRVGGCVITREGRPCEFHAEVCELHGVEWPDAGLCPAVRERELAMAGRCDQ